MKKYRVKAGKNSFSPMPLPRLFLGGGNRIFRGRAMFESDCKYNWLPDKDQWDWNKLCGVSLKVVAAKNDNAVIIAWRYNPTTDLFEVVPYFNESKKIFTGNKLYVSANEAFEFEIIQSRERWNVILNTLRTPIQVVNGFHLFPFRSSCQINIHSWVGGANNEEGPYGGKASQDMTLWYELNRL